MFGPDFSVAGADGVGFNAPGVPTTSTSRLRASRDARATALPIM